MLRALLAAKFNEEKDATGGQAAGPSSEPPTASKSDPSMADFPQVPAFTEYRTVVRDHEELRAAMYEGAAHIEIQEHITLPGGAYSLPPFYSLAALRSIRVRFSFQILHRVAIMHVLVHCRCLFCGGGAGFEFEVGEAWMRGRVVQTLFFFFSLDAWVHWSGELAGVSVCRRRPALSVAL
jgi:hypothetical protein